MQFLLIFMSLFCFASGAQGAPLPVYEVSLKDGVFTPPSIDVPLRQRFKIKIENSGTTPAEFENLSLRVEKVLGPGVRSVVIVPPLRAGTHIFVDEFHLNGPGFKINVKENKEG